ncbi:hypothetical protein [Streptomyces syringium]|uniref:hypothetical protein n=1 Tax=Streptomyces syringium TaxID=76729 RepID=UPI003426F7B0
MRDSIARLFAWVRTPFSPGGHTPQTPTPTPPEPRSPHHLDGALTGGDSAALWVTPHGIDIRPRPATRRPQVTEAFDIAPGTMVVDTVTGGMGRVRSVASSGMISVEHPNGYAWKACTVRPANSIERLNLLAADAAQASRSHRQADAPAP